MRLIIVVCVGFGILSLVSCSETQLEPVTSRTADQRSDQGQLEPHGPVVVQPARDELGGQGHASSQPEISHEPSRDHVNHSASHATRPGDAHGTASGHETKQSAHSRQKEEGHAHAAHGHASAAHDTSDSTKKIAVGEKVSDFEVTINGKPWKLSELQKNAAMTEDGILVLTFWCSFCHSCRHIEKHLDELARRYNGRVGVIAMDASAGETADGVAEFARERELTFPIALDASGESADVLGTRVTTTTVVIDKSGVLRYRGQFGDGQHAFAEDALRAVLAGEDIPVQETRQKG